MDPLRPKKIGGLIKSLKNKSLSRSNLILSFEGFRGLKRVFFLTLNYIWHLQEKRRKKSLGNLKK